MFQFISSILNDEHGISQEGWNNLLLVVRALEPSDEKNRILDLLDTVDAVDGRYFVP